MQPAATSTDAGRRPARRRWLGTVVALLGLAALTLALLPLQDTLSLAGVTLLYLVPVVGTAVVGGLAPALLAAVVADLLVNFFFLTPYHTLIVESPGGVVVLVVYVLVAASVAASVDVAARQRAAAAHRAAEARELVEVDRLRTALLDAVGHDLRTPLAGIKAAVSGLRQADIAWTPQERDELLATVELSTDRMVSLVENLLSMSRLQAGVLSVAPQPTALDAVVAEAAMHLPARRRVSLDVPDDLPLALADPGLLERVVANLLDNAVAATAVDGSVLVQGRGDERGLRLRVIDNGPGLSTEARERIFTPFQRFHDRGGGLGLGLAIARGFTEAMGGELAASQTPGGGLTMTVSLPRAVPPDGTADA
jgi:two-component system sensor histidine kinase KdpD